MFDSKHVDAILGRETEPRSRSGPFGVTPPRIFCTFHATVSKKGPERKNSGPVHP
jgi:hypothetical protein